MIMLANRTWTGASMSAVLWIVPRSIGALMGFLLDADSGCEAVQIINACAGELASAAAAVALLLLAAEVNMSRYKQI